MHESKNREIMGRLVIANDKARSFEDLSRKYDEANASEEKAKYHEKSQVCHQECADCVKELAESNSGAVSFHFKILYNSKGVKPGEPLCLITSEYSKMLLDEENSSNINTILWVESMERGITSLTKKEKLVPTQ